MFRYCKLIKDTYAPAIRPAPEGFLYPWLGGYNSSFRDPDGTPTRIGVIIKTKSESVDIVQKWFNDYLIKKYKRTH